VSRNQHLGLEPAVRGDPALADWQPVLSLVDGTLPADLITTIYPSFSNTRGLFAATRFESAKGGPAAFALAGNVKDAWLNGELIKPGATFTVAAKPGANVLVLQLDPASLPPALKLASGEVTFIND